MAYVKNDDHGNVRLSKRGTQNAARDDVAAALTLAAGAYARRRPKSSGCAVPGARWMSWRTRGSPQPTTVAQSSVVRALDRDGWRCQHCGRHGRMECDHRIPLDVAPEKHVRHVQPPKLSVNSCHWEKSRSERRGREPDPEVAKWRKYLTNHYLLCMLGGLPTT